MLPALLHRLRRLVPIGVAFVSLQAKGASQTPSLPDTQPLEPVADRSAQMVAGIDRFAQRLLDESVAPRAESWRRDFSSAEAYDRSVQPNRDRLRRIIGAVDPRVSPVAMELISTTVAPALLAETGTYRVLAVRWRAFGDVHGEGLLLQPKGAVRARVVALPDADQTPEMLAGFAPGLAAPRQLARRLAEHGAQVIVPMLIDRRDEFSGNPRIDRFTNEPHREWIYRPAFEMGRHIIGYEVQKVLAAVDWLTDENRRGPRVPVGVAGLAEGGLIALHAAALDPRIDATLVAGYFDSRQNVWAEPIYRNVFGLLREFGDAEIASLVVPRTLVVTAEAAVDIKGPPAARPGRAKTAAPGALVPPARESVRMEVARARALCGPELARALQLHDEFDAAVTAFAAALALPAPASSAAPQVPQFAPGAVMDADARQLRQLRELEEHTQQLVRRSETARNEFFWRPLQSAGAPHWRDATRRFREIFRDETIGRLPPPDRPANPRSRVVEERRGWICHEVVLDVWPDVFAWGYLLVPKDLAPGERRPVVVCQHGLEGLPADTLNEDPQSRAYAVYKAFAARLADEGFIVFAPHNPYRGGDAFRVLQRKLNPLRASLFSVIVAQHERILDWLGRLPFVDPARIGFYGLSYGGKTAMRVPALLDGYALSICSGDFNEWIWKNTTVDARLGYIYTPEYEMFEFNLGHTFNYAEMAALIAPRPFMVERGHGDGVAYDEWVAYEFAKVRRLYDQLGLPERTAIEFFNGPHTINGRGTFDFLHGHLDWPKR